MKTQLDDLRSKLADARFNMNYLEIKGLKDSDWYKELKEKELTIVSTINNMR